MFVLLSDSWSAPVKWESASPSSDAPDDRGRNPHECPQPVDPADSKTANNPYRGINDDDDRRPGMWLKYCGGVMAQVDPDRKILHEYREIHGRTATNTVWTMGSCC